jgi:hypothetical protein
MWTCSSGFFYHQNGYTRISTGQPDANGANGSNARALRNRPSHTESHTIMGLKRSESHSGQAELLIIRHLQLQQAHLLCDLFPTGTVEILAPALQVA